MADFVANLFGGKKPDAAAAPSRDAGGFADFAGAASPSPASSASPLLSATAAGATARPILPYTKWYRVWERTQPSDFYTEMLLLPFIVLTILVHLWGTNANRRRAKAWAKTHVPLIAQEYAVLGFGGGKKGGAGLEAVDAEALLRATESGSDVPPEVLREDSPSEFVSYATGRQNVAFLDAKITLQRRYNPFFMLAENVTGFFFESMPATQETVLLTAYTFDGKEKDVVPVARGDSVKPGGNSGYDGFVWAVVHKDAMKQLREDRYDISLTTTKEHPKLPAWASVMSENAEITETLLTAELAQAIKDAGDDLIALIISDQPEDKPKTLAETTPRKRITLHLKLSSYYPASTLALFQSFLRLPDTLVNVARFRPEVLKRIKTTREDEIRKLKKVADEEEAVERKEKADKEKKEKRDKTLAGLSADEQRKFLEREREKETRKMQKRRTMKG